MTDDPELATAEVGAPVGVAPAPEEPDARDETDAPGLPALGRYIAVDVLGEGGMGVVYRALDPQLDRQVAAKVVRRGWLGDEGEARLLREARAMAQVTHPNIVTVYDVTPCDAGVVVAMELVEGTDLKRWLRGTTRAWPDVVDAFLAAGRGLAAVHDAGLTHRDFKPANVLVADDGRVMVTDFGLALGTGGASSGGVARASAEASDASGGSASGGSASRPTTGSLQQLTRTGEVMGTPAYMAPEQRYGAPADPSSDQYAFCIALWEGLCGRRPPTDPPYERTPGAPVPPWPDPPSVPRALGDVLRRGLSTDPQGRFESMTALLTAIESARTPRRRDWAIATAVVLLGVGATAWVVTDPRTDPCADDPLAAIWGAEPRDAVAQAFAADGSPIAVESIDLVTNELDAYAEHYGQAHTTVCHAAADAPERDLQMACLADRRRALAGTVELLAGADDATVRHALDLTRRLPGPEACADPGGLRGEATRPSDPALAAAVGAIDALRERVEALTIAGRYDEAKALGMTLPEQAERLDYPPVYARALLARGMLQGALSHPEDGLADLRRAEEIAASTDDRTASFAASRIAYLLAWDLGRVDEGLVAARQGLAHAERIDPEGETATAAHATLCVVLSSKGELDEAVEHGQRAVDWYTAHGDTFNADHVRNELARIMIRRGDVAGAAALFERIVQSRRETLPPSHLEVANSISNLAAVRAQSGDFEAAEPLMQEGYDLRLAALGPDHMATIDSLSNLGHVHAELGKRKRAEREHRQALEAYERLLGPDHPRVANSLDAVANDLDARGDYEGAIALQRRALDILVGLRGPDHAGLALHHNNLANTLERAGRNEEAARHRARVEALTTEEERAILGW